MKLMVVDDEAYVLGSLKKLFEDTGLFSVRTAASGQAAIDLMASEPVDILLSDIRMPGISGFDLAEHSFQSNPDCHVIFLSGYADFDYIYRASRKNVKYLLKTEDDDVILETVLGEKRAIEEARTAKGEGALSAPERALNAALEEGDAGRAHDMLARFAHVYAQYAMDDREAEAAYQRALSLVIRHAKRETLDQAMKRLSQPGKCADWETAYALLEQTALKDLPGGAKEPPDKQALLEQVRGFIRAHLGENLSLSRIARHFAYNPSYISRVYRQAAGENLTDCVKRLRMEHAKECLAARELSVQTIAVECGFETPQYFARVFREETGYAPLEYRKAFRRDS